MALKLCFLSTQMIGQSWLSTFEIMLFGNLGPFLIIRASAWRAKSRTSTVRRWRRFSKNSPLVFFLGAD
jgi:hypothetical protein